MIRPPLAIVALLTITLSLTDGLLAAPFISEFLASNSEGLADEDGEASDWIEIHVPDGASLSLAGYTLTDDQENLTQWAFPDVTVEGGGYLIVFASGKDRSDPEQELHANFRLDNAGEYLALVAPDGTETVLVEDIVFGWGCRCVGFPAGDTIVPHRRTVAGDLVTSTSHLRMASTSPIRAEEPSMTSMICSN